MDANMEARPGPSDSRAPALASNPWGIALLLMLIGVLNSLDRILPGFLAELIKRDLALSDAALGFINGFGFLIVYAVAGIPIARLADRGRHAAVISLSLFLWSATTALGGLARSGLMFGLSRIGVALGEAGCSPAAHAYVAQNFSDAKRATALSMVTLGTPIGAMAAMIGGGMLASQFGWRATMIAVGLFGMALAPIAWLLLRRGRQAASGEEAASARWSDFAVLLRKRSALYAIVGAAMIATASYAMNAFGSAFFMRSHGLSVADTGLWLGLNAGVLGMIVLVASATMADRLSRRDPRWLLRVVAAMQLASAPLAAGAFLLGNVTAAMFCFALALACMNAYVAPTVAALYRLVMSDMRARTSAILLFMTSVVGGCGPLLVGIVSDRLEPSFGVTSLGHALLLVPAFCLAAALANLAASRRFSADVI
jgi:predicted MFS family arabinose efflux permease